MIALAAAGICFVAVAQQKQPAAAAKPAPAKIQSASPAAATAPVAAEQQAPAVIKKAEDLIEKVVSAYSGINSYTVRFDMNQIQMKATNKHQDKFNDKFELAYLKSNPASLDWMMRMTALDGYHKRTIVVYAKDEKGEYKFTVYKPAGRMVIGEKDPRAADIPFVELHKFVGELLDLVEMKTTKKKVQYFPETGQYVLTLQDDLMRNTTYIDGKSFMLVKQVLELRPKMKGDYQFKREIRWHGIKTGAKLTPGQITARPVKL